VENLHYKIEENYDFYEDYYDKPNWWFRFRYDTRYKTLTAWNFLIKHIKTEITSVLEIGFGSGDLIFMFDYNKLIHGIEISPSAVKKAMDRAKKRENENYNFQLLAEYNFNSEQSYDLVIASHVIEHIGNLKDFILNVKKVLRKNGYLLILVPINEKYFDPKHVHRFTTQSCMQFFNSNGFYPLEYEENEYFYHMVEGLYLNRSGNNWSILDNIKRFFFNFSLTIIPFKILKFLESVYKLMSNKKLPRQTIILFKKVD